MTNEQARLLDSGWKVVDVQGTLLYVDPVDGFCCSRDCAIYIQAQRDVEKKT